MEVSGMNEAQRREDPLDRFVRCDATRNGMQCTEAKGHEGRHKLPHAHRCHWPTCNEEVPPKLWGCKKHWFKLPKRLRNRIWATYKPGQEITKTPSNTYMKVALEVQDWCMENPDT
jgi:hypothetical protein